MEKKNKINKWTEREDNFLISEIFVENRTINHQEVWKEELFGKI